MRRKSFAGMMCPVARSLDVVGEWWTLLVVRDAMLGARRFDEFRRSGIADNILSARLDRLVSAGVLARQRYQEHPPRDEYVLTEKGRELMPVIYVLAQWGLKWTVPPWTDGPVTVHQFRHARCGTEVSLEFRCPTCDGLVPATEVELSDAVQVPEPTASPEPATAQAG